jgi:hypothetical protein
MHGLSTESTRVLAALDSDLPPTNPAVLLAAAREAYLAGGHTLMLRAIARVIEVEERNSPESFVPTGTLDERQRARISAVAFSLSSLVWGI